MKLIYILIIFTVNLYTYAAKLPVPRFVSIKSYEANARNAPNIKAPIEWVYVKKSEPVEIVAEYGQWRKIIDVEKNGGWVHSSVLSSKRYVIIKSQDIVNLFKSQSQNSHVIVKISPNVRCQLKSCSEFWCKINCENKISKRNYCGFIKKNLIWGVYDKEIF
jgi:SH3-like domain-containing protein